MSSKLWGITQRLGASSLPAFMTLIPASSSVVNSTIHRLTRLTRLDVMAHWHYRQSALDHTVALNPQAWKQWAIATPTDRHHIAWDPGEHPLWLGQRITIPQALDAYPLSGLELRLDLTWWAICSETYINGELIQAGDLFDCFGRVLLSPDAQPGDTIDVAIHLISPGHDPGALVKALLWFEPQDFQQPDPGMIADELAILHRYLQVFKPEALEQLEAIAQGFNWEQRHQADAFHAELTSFRGQLTQWSPWLQTRQIYWTGHAHLDLAWLWPVSETWDVAERTFASALNLMDEFPEMKFCHSSPALYDWIERNRPRQFARIQQKVKAGQWEIAAGLWVEPEFNLISGESLVRQVLYGQLYTQAKFGVLSATAWLPDSFGFCWQLPQILKQGGIDYFVTQKLRWNDSTEFPHEVFHWRSPDGTEIYSIMLPPIGTRIEPVKMTEFAQRWEQSTGNDLSYWLPGIGDHGGGPTRDMLEVARRWEHSPIIPKLQSTTSEAFCRQTETQSPQPAVWEDELYLEYHRGCYTSHADQKRYNRRCEAILTEAEMFSAIATILSDAPYPKAKLEQAWKQVLFNQFHDILPGSSIPQVFIDANRDWEAALQTGQKLREAALGAIAAQIDWTPKENCYPILVFNSLNWERREWVTVEINQEPLKLSNQVITADNQRVDSYLKTDRTICFWATVPAVGYRLYWISGADQDVTLNSRFPTPKSWGSDNSESFQLENEYLQVTIDATTGNIAALFDKQQGKNILSGPGNQLQFFRDQGQYWDAWNIDPNYAEHPLEGAKLTQIKWMDGHEQRIRTTLKFEASTFIQDYSLAAHTPYLTVETQVDWNTDHVLVKATFPLTLSTETVTCDMPCGVIDRPTLPNPKPLAAWQKAKWEIPAIHWADLTDKSGHYGVSLINDCKYGYDAQPSQLRLTLLRGSVWPDPDCDRGHHQFRYAIYPHAGNWQTARTTHLGYEFNRPLQIHHLTPRDDVGSFAMTQSFFSMPEQVVLMAFKQSEMDANRWILRFYECEGQHNDLEVLNHLELEMIHPVDGLERPVINAANDETHQEQAIAPWQIMSLELEPSPEHVFPSRK